MQKTIFVVDDNDINLTIAKEALKDQYRVMTMPSAARMFALLEKITPNLILLDIEMPEMDGFETLHRLKSNAAHAAIPVIFLTGVVDAATEVRGFQLGVVDFITKPFSTLVLQNRINTHLSIDDLIRERTKQLVRLQNGIVFTLADMVENRDHGTGGHIERTTTYMEILVKAMTARGILLNEDAALDLDSLVSSARLHDVGKISISDTILNKPDKLTEEEFAIMRSHTTEGERIIGQIVSRTGDKVFLRSAQLFAGYHHERWDGKGYPYGLAGTNIPLHGRIMAIVDVYDALTSERPYKKPMSHEEAVNIIMAASGTQFDPDIAAIFFEINDQIEAAKQENE